MTLPIFSLSHHSGKESINFLFAFEMEADLLSLVDVLEEDDLFEEIFDKKGEGARLDTVLMELLLMFFGTMPCYKVVKTLLQHNIYE